MRWHQPQRMHVCQVVILSVVLVDHHGMQSVQWYMHWQVLQVRIPSCGARPGPAAARAPAGKGCAPADEGAKINGVNSKMKLLKSPENNFDIDIFIDFKESIDIADIQCISCSSADILGTKISISYHFQNCDIAPSQSSAFFTALQLCRQGLPMSICLSVKGVHYDETKAHGEKRSVMTNRKSSTSFPMSLWTAYVNPNPLKSKIFVVFRIKNWTFLEEICYKVSLHETFQPGKVVRHSLVYLTVHKWLVGSSPSTWNLGQSDPPPSKRRLLIDIWS